MFFNTNIQLNKDTSAFIKYRFTSLSLYFHYDIDSHTYLSPSEFSGECSSAVSRCFLKILKSSSIFLSVRPHWREHENIGAFVHPQKENIQLSGTDDHQALLVFILDYTGSLTMHLVI